MQTACSLKDNYLFANLSHKTIPLFPLFDSSTGEYLQYHKNGIAHMHTHTHTKQHILWVDLA